MPPPIPLLLWLAPLFLAFEAAQLVLAERYIGVKQLARHADPRDLGPRELVAFFWIAGIVIYWLWMLALVAPAFGRLQALCMLAVSVGGVSLRRQLGAKWCLVILTFEGAIRIGMIVSLLGAAWRRL